MRSTRTTPLAEREGCYLSTFAGVKELDIAEVRKVASLARLALSEEELQASGEQLTTILDYVRLLDEVDLAGVEPMTHPVPGENVFRADDLLPSLPREAALSNAPKSDGQFFLVPKILEEKGA